MWFVIGAIVVIALVAAFFYVRRPKLLMFQWGKFENTRLGLQGKKPWDDEPQEVTYTDFKYWVRIKPNPGFNVPVLGYWSKAKGRKR